MSGDVHERTSEPTLDDHVARIRNLDFQLSKWSFHPDLAAQLSADLEQHRNDFPEAAAVYDAERAEVEKRILALAQRAGEITLPRS